MKVRKVEADMKENTQTRIALLEQSLDHTRQILDRIESKMDHGFGRVEERISFIDKRIDTLDGRLDKLDSNIDRVRSLCWSQFRWLMATLMTVAGAVFSDIIMKNLHIF